MIREHSRTHSIGLRELGTAHIAAEHIVRCELGPRGTVGVPWVCPSNRPPRTEESAIRSLVIWSSYTAIKPLVIYDHRAIWVISWGPSNDIVVSKVGKEIVIDSSEKNWSAAGLAKLEP